MRKCPLNASSVSSGDTGTSTRAPGGTGPGFAQPLKCELTEDPKSQIPNHKPESPVPSPRIPDPGSGSRVPGPHSSSYHSRMARTPPVAAPADVSGRLCAFVLERFPFALPLVRDVLQSEPGRALVTASGA